MSRTHLFLTFALACAAASACAHSNGSGNPVRATLTSAAPQGLPQVRNYDGDALPPYALGDAQAYLEIQCRDGEIYQVVDRSPDLYSSTLKRTTQGEHSLKDICYRVQATRMDFGR